MISSENFEPELTAFVSDLLKEDDLGVVVRVHIRIESALRDVIKSLLTQPTLLDKMDMDYFNTVHLAGALGVNKTYIPSLNAIGTLRNKFAHDLNTVLDSNSVTALYDSLASDHKDEVQKMSRTLWVAHELQKDFPGFKKLQPRDRFVSIAVILWGSAVGAVLHLQDSPRGA